MGMEAVPDSCLYEQFLLFSKQKLPLHLCQNFELHHVYCNFQVAVVASVSQTKIYFCIIIFHAERKGS